MPSKERKKRLEANIWKFYLYRVFSGLVFTGPIFILFLLDNNLSMTQVMVLQAVYTFGIMLLAVPAGIAADYIGRKKVMVLNALFFTLGWLAYASGRSFWSFFIAELILAISAALWMASGTALFYDTLKELKQEHCFKRLWGNVVSINYLVWGLAGLAGGFMAAYSLRLPFWLTVIPISISALVTFSFTDTKLYKHKGKHCLTHLKDAAKFASSHPKVRLFIAYAAVMYAVGFSMFMLFQPFFKQVGLPLIYFGVVFFFMEMLGALGSKLAHRIEEFLGEKKMLIVLVAVPILYYLGMAQFAVLIAVLLPVIGAFFGGIYEPVILDYINKHTESHHRATVLSLSTLVSQFFGGVAAPFFGWVVDFWSLQTAFLIASAALAVNLALLLAVFYIVPARNS